MKKIVLLPKTDTVILCLPKEWIGIPVMCTFAPLSEELLSNYEQDMKIEAKEFVNNEKIFSLQLN
ncbi:MAG: hypothetical protein LBI45_02505 [Bacteroidales bacterium]|jgi:hypothetical protein|nr:hypothetical protein [Bacteroidales bacterium]